MCSSRIRMWPPPHLYRCMIYLCSGQRAWTLEGCKHIKFPLGVVALSQVVWFVLDGLQKSRCKEIGSLLVNARLRGRGMEIRFYGLFEHGRNVWHGGMPYCRDRSGMHTLAFGMEIVET